MERDKRKKSKIPYLFGGNGENSNRKTVQPRSPTNDLTDQKLFKYEIGQTSSKQVYGTPMKTLLAKEMLNETSTKKWSPSLIAKLMGLDGLPSPQPIHKQQKKVSQLDDIQKNSKRNEKPYNYQLNNKTTTEQQHFKDVYEDPEASHVTNQLYSSPKRRSTKQECGYIQERCDEMLKESLAIKNKLERVDSNSELMFNFLHKDQQICNHITVLKPSNSVRNGPHGNYHVPISHQRYENENENDRVGYFRRSPRYQEEKKDANAINVSPTRIVVLKPNLAKIYNNDQVFILSPDNCRKINTESSSVRSSRHKSREAREIARHITSQMKEGFSQPETFDRPRRSSSSMSESAVIREAKKRMSHRWKTHGYKDVDIVDKTKNSTLEQMLSVPNNETRHDMGPIGPDYEYLINTSRSRSLPPSFTNRNHRTSDYYHEIHADEKIMVHNEPYNRRKNKGVNGNYNNRESLRFSKSKKIQSPQHCSACYSPEFDTSLQGNHFSRKPNKTYFENVFFCEQESMISDIHDEDSSNSQEASTANSQSIVSIQLSGPEAEPESSEGSKEVDQKGQLDQNGQLSVLEIPPAEDVSSGSDCFERVSSRLHELRKQLHLLKMESGSTYDSQNDEEIESLFTVSESENWESNYLTDFLQNSGFYDHDPNTFMTTCYSSNCNIDPCLFDNLEKKYSHDSTVSRSERQLFHDRITEALFVISKNMVSCSWVNPGQRGIQKALTEIGFEDQLQKLLAKQEKEANEDFEEISVEKDRDWLKSVEEIDIVGKQIAEVLVNELLLEILTV